MIERDAEHALVQRFLLGSASEEERQQVEARLFAEPAFVDELQAREDDLVDDYAHERLAPAERRQFESRWLSSPERRTRVEFARAARRLQPPARRRVLPAWLPTAAAALLAAGTTVLGWRALELGGRLEAERTRAASRERELAQLLANAQRVAPRVQPAEPPVVALPPASNRDGGSPPEVRWPAGAELVGLAAPVAARWGYVSYAAVIRTAEDAFVWEDAGLTPVQGRLIVTLPTDALPAGDYILTLSGRRRSGRPVELADHYFRVVGR